MKLAPGLVRLSRAFQSLFPADHRASVALRIRFRWNFMIDLQGSFLTTLLWIQRSSLRLHYLMKSHNHSTWPLCRRILIIFRAALLWMIRPPSILPTLSFRHCFLIVQLPTFRSWRIQKTRSPQSYCYVMITDCGTSELLTFSTDSPSLLKKLHS